MNEHRHESPGLELHLAWAPAGIVMWLWTTMLLLSSKPFFKLWLFEVEYELTVFTTMFFDLSAHRWAAAIPALLLVGMVVTPIRAVRGTAGVTLTLLFVWSLTVPTLLALNW